MRVLFLLLNLATLAFDLSNGCSSSTGQPSYRTIPLPAKKAIIVKNKIQVTTKIRPISFEVEWIIENFETLAMAEVEELKSDHFIFEPFEQTCWGNEPKKQCTRHIFQMICNPYISYQKIIHLDFQLKKLKSDVEKDDNDHPTLGYFSFNAKYINYEMFSEDQTYLGSSRGTKSPINFGIGKRDGTVFRIYKEDIKSNDLKVGMNITILFQV